MSGRNFVVSFCLICFITLGISLGHAEEVLSPFPNSSFWEKGNIRLHYRLWFPYTPRVQGKVLLLHGLGGSTFSWRYAQDFLLQAGYLVVAVDLPGFGYSSRIKNFDYRQENRSRLFWEFLDALDNELGVPWREKPWHLVGHSMGGQTAFFMGMERPERTESIVFVATPFRSASPDLFRLINSCSLLRGVVATLLRRSLRSSRVKRLLTSAYGRKPT